MKRVIINPGVCGFVTQAEAVADEEENTVRLTVDSPCKAVCAMMEAAGDTFDAYELCLSTPGTGPLYGYAAEHFPVHAACPVVAGILKCAEAEAGLALPRESSIRFVD